MSYTCQVFFNNVDQGTLEMRDESYPEDAAKAMMILKNIKVCSHIEVICEELNLKYDLYEVYINKEDHLIRTIYGQNLKHPYNQSDGYKVWNHRRAQCDHSGLMKHRTCFRPIHTTIYADDALGWATPVLQFCRFHSGTDKTEIGYHD